MIRGTHKKFCQFLTELTTQLLFNRAEFTSFIRVPSMDPNCLMEGSGDCMFRLFR